MTTTLLTIPKPILIYQRIFLILALLLLAPKGYCEPVHLPDMGDPSATVLSHEEERLLGQAFMRNVRRSLDIIEDVEIHTYINSLGYKLLASTDTSQTDFTFFVVDQANINAFAGPGGYIGIHTGLILEAQTEGELAAVVAHEIAHVTQRHLARAFQKASRANLQAAAAIIAAIILGSQDPELAQAAIIAATAGNIQQQLNFTRGHEKEADWLGIDILAQAGYNPDHMAGFFKRLQEAVRFSDNTAITELLRTHPVTANRISDAQNRAGRYPQITDRALPNFEYVQAKLNAAQKHSDSNYLIQLENEIQISPKPEQLLRYEYALALLMNNHIDRAKKIAEQLLKEDAEHINFITLNALTHHLLGQYNEAEKQLADALMIYPNHPWLTVLYVESLIANNRAEIAGQKMRALIEEQGRFAQPSYYRLLAKAQQAGGTQVDSYLSLAEYYYLLGHTRTAITQLENALELPSENGVYDKQRIKARLAVLKEEALQKQAFERSK